MQKFVDELSVGDTFYLPQGNPDNKYILKECTQSSDEYFVRYKKIGGGKYKRRQNHRMIVCPITVNGKLFEDEKGV